MSRYFIEVGYRGTNYAGFQIQSNAVTIQSELERALHTLFKQPISLTGSSRTDAGVHARQNFFHFDSNLSSLSDPRKVYNLNAILPVDIAVHGIYKMPDESHSRFDALRREYMYYIYQEKNPFLNDRAYFYPYPLDMAILQKAASMLQHHTDFTSFSKRNTQVKNFLCTIYSSEWHTDGEGISYRVSANRFLRGMVKGLVGTMLLVGTGKISLSEFEQIILSRDCTNADFSVPPHGLFLEKVVYEEDIKNAIR